MENQNPLKSFFCNIHPHEPIQRVYIEPNSARSLYCIDCILKDSHRLSKESILNVKDFIEQVDKQYESFRSMSKLETSAPNDLVEFLPKEGETLEKLAQHIEQQKNRVNEAFNIILQEFALLCHQKKEDIYKRFDMQLITLKLNYGYYKSKIDKYYNKEKGEDLNPDKQTLIERINQCNSTDEVEVLVKNIKDDILEQTTLKDPKEQIKEIQEGLLQMAQELKAQSIVFPKTVFNEDSSVSEYVKKFKDTVKPLMEQFETINDENYELNLSQMNLAGSKLVKNRDEARILKKWISPNKDVGLKLLYRGSKDGFSNDTFHKKCDNVDKTLIIMKSNFGKICGGYSDLDWNSASNYKQSAKTWLFSLDHKQKFPIKSSLSMQATYSASNTGPVFGGGHDLAIYLDENSGFKCYSNLGHAYQTDDDSDTTKNQSLLTGAYQFKVEEIEVYAIDIKESAIPSDDIESVLLDPKKDLGTLRNWISKGKKIEFELLYRGTRDGFDAKDFHSLCDSQGPTLVVCKSASYEKTFGGFTSADWKQSEDYVADKHAFLFSLTNNTKLPIMNSNYAIFCASESGPVFGVGYDLFICPYSNIVADSHSNPGMTYKVSDEMGDPSSYLAGGPNFLVQELEVFKVIIK